MKPRIYLDTSVIGGCFDLSFQHDSGRLMDLFKSRMAFAVISDITLFELDSAPERVRAVLDEIPKSQVQVVHFSPEARELANEYIAAGVISLTWESDAQHIAIATVNRVNAVVSWNFKHIVNLRKILGYNSVNIRQGYPVIEIRTPKEVFDYEEEED